MKLKSALMAASALAFVAPAVAQDDEQRDQIVVTGSYIQGVGETGVLPVDVFSQEDLQQIGIDSPREFIKTLSSIGPVLGDSNQFSAGTEQGVGSVNLRSLGRERTLVLFNGRRSIVTPGDGAVDTQLIPLFALSRIEILKDGAASTYGSDAIAGVANFVTRENFEGVELAGDYNFIDGSDGDYQVSALFGKNFDRGNVMVGVGYQHRSELDSFERDFTLTPYDVNPTGWSFISNPGTYFPGFGPLQTGSSPGALAAAAPAIDGNQLGACDALGGVTGILDPISNLPVCRYSYVPFDNLVEETDQLQVYGQMDYAIKDDLSFHLELLYAKTDLDSINYSPSYPPVQGPDGSGSTYRFAVPTSNPGYADYLAQTYPTGSTAFLTQVLGGYTSSLLGRPFALGGNPLNAGGEAQGFAQNEAFRVSGGLEKDFTDNFRGQLYVTYFDSQRDAASPDIIGGRLQLALEGLGGPDCDGVTPGANGCLYFNPFINAYPGNPALGLDNPAYVPGNENDPAVIDWFAAEYGTIASEKQTIIDLIFDGTTDIPGKEGVDFGYAFGAQYRDSNFVTNPIDEFSDPEQTPCSVEGVFDCLDDPLAAPFPIGPFIFLGQFPAADLEQDVYALFAEGVLSIGDNLELTAAARFEDYGDPIGSTFNPKGGVRWQVTDTVALRGSLGSTFRAPLAGDVAPGGASGVAGIDAAGGAFKATQGSGNPNLEPETAITSNVGFLYEKGGFNFSVDYWQYDFEGRFTGLPLQAIANNVSGGPGDGSQLVDCSSPFTQFIVFQGRCTQGPTVAQDIVRIFTQTVNGPDVKTSGLDFGMNYDTTLGRFDVALGGTATHTINYEFGEFEFEGLTFDGAYDAAGFANYDRAPGTVSEWRANAYASAVLDQLSFGYFMQYIGGVEDNRCPDDAPCIVTPEFGGTDFGRTIDAYVQHDLWASYDIPVMGADVNLRFGIENITDEDPSEARLEYSYDPFIGNPLGRIYRISTRINF